MSSSIGVHPSPAGAVGAVGAVGGLTARLGGKCAGVWLKGLGFGGVYAGMVLGYCILVIGWKKVGIRAAVAGGSRRVGAGTEEAVLHFSR